MTRTIVVSFSALVALSTVVSVAQAEDTFESKAARAVKVKNLEDVVWALASPCDKGDDLQQRQCRLLRDARAKGLANATLLIEAESSALEIGKWDGAKRSVSISLTACIRCSGVQVDGRAWHITGAPARLESSTSSAKLTTATLYDNARQFPDDVTARKWLKTVKGARVQLVAKIPEKRRWQVGGKDGLLFDVIAWRAVQPCSGEVVISSPKSGPADRDKTACGAEQTQTQTTVVAELTREMVSTTMQPVVQAARACYAKHKAAGKARLDIAIAADGSIGSYTQSGDFKGSPTGQCIDIAVGNLQFPASQKPMTTIGYPIVLP